MKKRIWRFFDHLCHRFCGLEHSIYSCGCTTNGWGGGHNFADEARVCALFNLKFRDEGKPLEEIGRILHPELQGRKPSE